MNIKPTHIDHDIKVREIILNNQKFKQELKENTLNGYRSDYPSVDRCDYIHRTLINREAEDSIEDIRRIGLMEQHLEISEKGLNMVNDILVTMLEISEDASAVYVGEVIPKFLEHNIHLKRLKDEFYSVVKLYKTGDVPLFVTVNSNTSGTINVDYNIHLDSNNTTRLFYESPKIMDETTAKNGLAANRPILSLDRLFYSSELVYNPPAVPPQTISTNIYANNITLIEECLTRVKNYIQELTKLSTRLEFRKKQMNNILSINRNIWKRDIETDSDVEARIANNRFLVKKTNYNI